MLSLIYNPDPRLAAVTAIIVAGLQPWPIAVAHGGLYSRDQLIELAPPPIVRRDERKDIFGHALWLPLSQRDCMEFPSTSRTRREQCKQTCAAEMAVRYAALCVIVIRQVARRDASYNGTDGQTDRRTDRQTEFDAICGPLLGRRAA